MSMRAEDFSGRLIACGWSLNQTMCYSARCFRRMPTHVQQQSEILIIDASAARRRERTGNFVLVLCALLLTMVSAKAQTSVRVSVGVPQANYARVEGVCETGEKIWSFRNDYAGVLGLTARIENFSLQDENDANINFQQLAPGEFETPRAAKKFRYDLKLDAPPIATDAPFISWLNATRGILQLGDMLPRALHGRIKIRFTSPAKWRVVSAETQAADESFTLSDAESAVFLVAREVKEQSARAQAMNVKLAMVGEWAFAFEDVSKSVSEIVAAHAKTFGAIPSTENPRALVLLSPFPSENVPANLWSAATRGNTVIFCSGKLPSKIAALAQLQPPLTHELFHLWIPNAVALKGEYGWFYEGFTLYEAARISVQLGYITFQDFLTALARAFDAYKLAASQKDASLLEVSRARWSGGNSLVYNKGMLVAFLYDLTRRRNTNGKRSLQDVYRTLFAQHNLTHARVDGNTAVMKGLNDDGDTQDFIARYVVGTERIDLARMLASFGLRVEWNGFRTLITVAAPLDRAQRRTLRELGYDGR